MVMGGMDRMEGKGGKGRKRKRGKSRKCNGWVDV